MVLKWCLAVLLIGLLQSQVGNSFLQAQRRTTMTTVYNFFSLDAKEIVSGGEHERVLSDDVATQDRRQDSGIDKDAQEVSQPQFQNSRLIGLSRDGFSNYLRRSEFLRFSFVSASGTFASQLPIQQASAFEGGVGGLGKTKPNMGFNFLDDLSKPVQNEKGIVSSEIVVGDTPVLLQFQTPWPLLPTTEGIEARDLRSSESAFVQVVERVPLENKKAFKTLLIDTVLGSKGKFGMYGSPTNVRMKTLESDPTVASVTFTALTPSMIETDRQILVKATPVGDSLILLVAGTTLFRFKSQETSLMKVVDSFEAVEAPRSSRMR